MKHLQDRVRGMFSVTPEEFSKFIKPKRKPGGLATALLLIVGILLTPVTLIGALFGFARAYNRFDAPMDKYPRLAYMRPITRVGMVMGGIVIWVFVYVAFNVLWYLLTNIFANRYQTDPSGFLKFVAINIFATLIVFVIFTVWRRGIVQYINESQRYGTARFAREDELLPYTEKKGFYIGEQYHYSKSGHLLTVAGTRAGKGVNLILPNLLTPGRFNGSWVVIDPKGENAAISARVQREAGRKVVILNPWNLLDLGGVAYNPLDLLKSDRLNLSDDVQLIAEGIVPMKAEGDNDHFNSRARTYIAGLLMHLMTAAPTEDRHLGTIWKWLRLDNEKWIDLLADMSVNDDPNAGEIVQATANEIASLMKQGEREYASIISTAQKFTDFLKSPAMRDCLSISQDFHSHDLADGNTTVYVIIPADRLKTHSQWLRLVVTSLMRSVIRNPRNEVCFLLDEFYALGFLSEIEIALGAYAGYGIHVWAILQNLVQLQDLYGKNWENFLSSCSVRHFFNVSDNTTAEYISKMFGSTSIPSYNPMGQLSGATGRSLVNADELRRYSGDTIYTVIDQLSPAEFMKFPYYLMGLDHDPNPYFKEKASPVGKDKYSKKPVHEMGRA